MKWASMNQVKQGESTGNGEMFALLLLTPRRMTERTPSSRFRIEQRRKRFGHERPKSHGAVVATNGTHGGTGGYAAAVSGSANPTSAGAAAATATTSAQKSSATEKAPNDPAQSALARIGADNEAQIQCDGDEADVELDPTIAEDLDYDEIWKKPQKCENTLRKRQKRHEKELNAVQETKDYIEEQQSHFGRTPKYS